MTKVGLFVACVLALWCVFAAESHAEESRGAESVGVILPLTGDFNYFGEQVRQGMTIALDELSAAGNRVPRFVFEDDKCLPKDGVTAYRRLVDQEHVSLVIGPGCSAAIHSVSPVAETNKTPVLFLLDTGEKVASLPDPLYSFGFDPPAMARTLARDLFKRGMRRISTITEEEEYAVLISDAFQAEWQKLGGELLANELKTAGGTEFRPTIGRAMSRKPEALFFSAAYVDGVFLKQLRVLAPNIPVYGNDTMCVTETIDVAQAAAEGARCANVLVEEQRKEVQAFRAALTAKFGKAPASLFYPALGYDAVQLALRELHLPVGSAKPLLGVSERNSAGMYDITPTILEIKGGTLTPVIQPGT